MKRRYSLDYRVLRIDHHDFADDAVGFAALMEEPYHAPNVLTHFRMRQRMKADGIDVALCGSGGDEVFAGYDSDFWPAAYRELRAAGRRRDAFTGELFFRLGTQSRARDTAWSALKWPKRTAFRLWRAHCGATDGGTAASNAASNAAIPDGDWRDLEAERLAALYPRLSLFAQRRYHFEIGLLPHYLATDDRFTMGIPLEQRNPFLDYRLVELGLALPPEYLFRDGWTKYILRCAMAPYLPGSIVWRRRKRGFPLQMRAFLHAQRHFLAPLVGADYDAELRRSPARLWRLCSTALWRQTLEPGTGAGISVPAAAG
jgi:asparagine synthase (glutamine-hydrolysing)